MVLTQRRRRRPMPPPRPGQTPAQRGPAKTAGWAPGRSLRRTMQAAGSALQPPDDAGHRLGRNFRAKARPAAPWPQTWRPCRSVLTPTTGPLGRRHPNSCYCCPSSSPHVRRSPGFCTRPCRGRKRSCSSLSQARNRAKKTTRLLMPYGRAPPPGAWSNTPSRGRTDRPCNGSPASSAPTPLGG